MAYRPDTCAFCNSDTWCDYLPQDGRPQCRGCRAINYFERFLFAPLGYRALWWHKKVLRDLYGTVDPQTGRRRYRRAYISMGKRQGKTFLIAGTPLYHLHMEQEIRPHAYGAAASHKQAGLVFSAAVDLIRANPMLKEIFAVTPSTKRIFRKDGGGIYEAIAADGHLNDGIGPSLAILDELHRWTTQKMITSYDVIRKGTLSREEPLTIQITTAGSEYESPLWWREYQYALAVRDGAIVDPEYYVFICQADPKRIDTEPDYWKSREARMAANPSHEGYKGGFVKDSAIVAEMNIAIADAAEYPKYLRYHLNVPAETIDKPVIDMPRWQAQDQVTDVDLRKYIEYDVDYLIMKWGLRDRPCWCGVDASWTNDFTAAVFVFPPFAGVEAWTFLPFCWVPAERMNELERVCRVPLRTWVKQKFVVATPGNAIDLRYVKDRIKWGKEIFDLREVPFDRCNFRAQAMEMVDDGTLGPEQAIEVHQNFMQLSAPTKFILTSYQDQKIRHGNNPVLNWMASCLALQYDRKDGCQPTKPERLKSQKRIDMISAAVTALNRALGAEISFRSIYADAETAVI